MEPFTGFSIHPNGAAAFQGGCLEAAIVGFLRVNYEAFIGFSCPVSELFRKCLFTIHFLQVFFSP